MLVRAHHVGYSMVQPHAIARTAAIFSNNQKKACVAGTMQVCGADRGDKRQELALFSGSWGGHLAGGEFEVAGVKELLQAARGAHREVDALLQRAALARHLVAAGEGLCAEAQHLHACTAAVAARSQHHAAVRRAPGLGAADRA